MFTELERAFLDEQRLLRLATVGSDGQPIVDAVGFQFDGQQFVVGGHDLTRTRKHRNVIGGNRQVSLILDDLAPGEGWNPRGVRVNGLAEVVTMDAMFGPGAYLVIRPTVSWSWGIERDEVFVDGAFRPHKTTWPAATEEHP